MSLTDEYNRVLDLRDKNKRATIIAISKAIHELESGNISEAHTVLVQFLDKLIEGNV